jgi:hypothetical protein
MGNRQGQGKITRDKLSEKGKTKAWHNTSTRGKWKWKWKGEKEKDKAKSKYILWLFLRYPVTDYMLR